MARCKYALSTLLALSLFLAAAVLIINVEATSIPDQKALIVISSVLGTDQHEVDKAVAFHDYLIDQGYSEGDIEFLCMEDISFADGRSTKGNVKTAFDTLIEESTEDTELIIYISDNNHFINGKLYYQFVGGDIPCSSVEDWVDNIEFSELTFINNGPRSGLFGAQLQGDDRIIMSSMEADQTCSPDQFNITRSLEDSSADANNDGVVSIIEAFNNEEQILEETGQTPLIWV
ncbi:MAG: hypothetical protein ACMUIE_06205 [Thermoplasmatota archaeon]